MDCKLNCKCKRGFPRFTARRYAIHPQPIPLRHKNPPSCHHPGHHLPVTPASPSYIKKTGLSAQVGRPGNKLFYGTASRRFQRLPHLHDHRAPALIDRCQLLRLGSACDSSLLNRLGNRSRINSIEDGGTYKDGEKEGDYIHTYAKEQRLPATDCIEG